MLIISFYCYVSNIEDWFHRIRVRIFEFPSSIAIAMSRDVASEMRRKSGGPPDQRRTAADVVNEKATTDSLPAERRETDGREAAEDDVWWPKMLVGREQNGDRSCCRVPVATRLRCIVRNSQREVLSDCVE